MEGPQNHLEKDNSSENEFRIDVESGYFIAQRFLVDPVAYFEAYRQSLVTEGYDDSEFGLRVMDHLMELEEIISNEDIRRPANESDSPQIESPNQPSARDERVVTMMNSEYGSEEWAQSVFTILRDAGFTYEQVLFWLDCEEPDMTAEEKLKERGLRITLKSVFSIT